MRNATLPPIPLILAGFVVALGLSCDSKPRNPPRLLAQRSTVALAAAPAEAEIVAGQTLYVPLYSQVFTADSAQPLDLAVTVFVRNTDRSQPIILTRVESFDSGGKSLRSLLKSPLRIGPMAVADFFVEESDETGGASPSFLIEWVATAAVSDPVAESVMIGTSGSQGISFSSQSRVVQTRKHGITSRP